MKEAYLVQIEAIKNSPQPESLKHFKELAREDFYMKAPPQDLISIPLGNASYAPKAATEKKKRQRRRQDSEDFEQDFPSSSVDEESISASSDEDVKQRHLLKVNHRKRGDYSPRGNSGDQTMEGSEQKLFHNSKYVQTTLVKGKPLPPDAAVCSMATMKIMSELLYKLVKPGEIIGTDARQPVLRIPPKPQAQQSILDYTARRRSEISNDDPLRFHYGGTGD